MTDPVKWFAAEVTALPDAAEALEFAFNSLDALGTEINHLQYRNADKIHVVGYFNQRLDDQRVQDEVHYALRTYDLDGEAVERIEWTEVENADWLLEWKKHWKPTEIGRFVIAPPWEEVADYSKIVIKIEPNMAFGTGTHETTQLCIKAIDEKYIPGDSFLDVGTGTGILAIAAAKLATEHTDLLTGNSVSNPTSVSSVTKIYACDTDFDSVKLARENAELNLVSGHIEFVEGPLPTNAPVYDFVCSNLTIDVILPILSLLLSKTQKTLVLSGILVEQQDQLDEALLRDGVSDVYIETAGQWIAAVIHPAR